MGKFSHCYLHLLKRSEVLNACTPYVAALMTLPLILIFRIYFAVCINNASTRNYFKIIFICSLMIL